MTRKDYVLIAEAMKFAVDAEKSAHEITGNSPKENAIHIMNMNTLRNAAVSLCQALANDNPRFESERFLAAANLRFEDLPLHLPTK